MIATGARSDTRRRSTGGPTDRSGSAIAALAALLLSIGTLACAANKDIYWTRSGASEKQFRQASRRCSESAILTLANEGGGDSCTYNTEAGGTFCTRPDPNDPFQVKAEQQRKQRRLRYLYGECLEGAGWTSNTDGKGHKGRY